MDTTPKKRKMNPSSLKNLKRVPKGSPSFNPRGAGAHDPVKRELKRLSSKILKEILTEVLMGKPSDIGTYEQLKLDPGMTNVKLVAASAIRRAGKYGDWGLVDRILERTVGKVPTPTDITSKGKEIKSAAQGPQVVLMLPDNTVPLDEPVKPAIENKEGET